MSASPSGVVNALSFWSMDAGIALDPSSVNVAPPTLTTVSSSPTSGGSPTRVSATGDPHLMNIYGQRFDLMHAGTFVLIQIPRVPRGKKITHSLLNVAAEAQRFGSACSEMYFQELNITGTWVKGSKGILKFHAQTEDEEESKWMTFGGVSLKVAHGHNEEGIRYLNLYIKHLGRTKYQVGGLLGGDDHKFEATPDKKCAHYASLMLKEPKEEPLDAPERAGKRRLSASSAEASLV